MTETRSDKYGMLDNVCDWCGAMLAPSLKQRHIGWHEELESRMGQPDPGASRLPFLAG